MTNFASTWNTKCALVDFKEEVMQNLLLLHRHNMMSMVLGHGLLVNASNIATQRL